MAEPKILLENLIFAEGPRWHDGRLWFSDMYAHEVVAVDMDGNRETMATVPNQPSGLGFLPDGTPLVVSMKDMKLLRLDSSGPKEVADLSGLAAGETNDMVVDGQGRAYIGHLGYDVHGGGTFAPASLILVTPDGEVREVADDLAIPNGTVITPDGKTLIVAESRGPRLTAFDIEADGSLTNRRVWAEMEGTPDGICLDAENCIWVGVPRNPGSFVRVAEGGEIKERIDLPDQGGIACVHGGPDRRTLFLLEATSGRPSEIKGRGNGRIRMVYVDVPGAGWP